MTSETGHSDENQTPFQRDLRRRQIASFGAVKIVTRDQHAALKEIRAALKYEMSVWSCASGIWDVKTDGSFVPNDAKLRDPFDLGAKLRHLIEKEWVDRHTLLITDFDSWLDDEPVVRRQVVEAMQAARALGHLLLFVSRHDKLHPSLSDELNTLRHPLPNREATRAQLMRLATRDGVEVDETKALDIVQGLTSSRQADAIGLGLAEAKIQGTKTLDLAILRRFKELEIGRLNYLKVSEPERGFADIIGHDYLKTWLREQRLAFSERARAAGVPVPRGMLLVGPPGTAKTRLSEALAGEWSMPFLTLNLAGVFSSMLGESEANIANALEIAERMSPCVLLIDEVESVVHDDGGDRDGGTTERVIGQLLSWAALKKEPVFLVLTSNVAKGLPPALLRKGRLDENFFVDFPSAAERTQIFDYYLAKAPSAVKDVKALVRATADFSGAEVEDLVLSGRRKAFADGERVVTDADILAAIAKTIPVSKSMSAKVDAMREWAGDNAQSTSYPDETGSKPWSGSADRKVEA